MLARSIEGLASFAAYAMPLIDVLADLPAAANWSEWIGSPARSESAEREPGGIDRVAAVYPSVQVEVMERGALERPGGRRFGVLVHAILASIDLDADSESVRSMAAINAGTAMPRRYGCM